MCAVVRRVGLCGHVVRVALALLVAASNAASEAHAARPEVEFDAAALVAAEDATTAEFRAAHPGEKLIAARVEISPLVRRGSAADLAEILFRVEAGDREMHLFDFAPKTTFAPLAAGNVAVERDTDTQTSLKANASGRYFPFAEGAAAFDRQTNEQTRLRYELPAPQEVVVTSGSIERRRGVFVKLRASRRGSLEGAKSIVVLYAVPQNWRAGVLTIHAEARSTVGGVLGKESEAVVCGAASLATGIYLTGDLEARHAVERLIAADKAWLNAQTEHARRQNKGFDDQLRAAFDDVFAFAASKSKRDHERVERIAAEAELATHRATRDAAAGRLDSMNANPRE